METKHEPDPAVQAVSSHIDRRKAIKGALTAVVATGVFAPKVRAWSTPSAVVSGTASQSVKLYFIGGAGVPSTKRQCEYDIDSATGGSCVAMGMVKNAMVCIECTGTGLCKNYKRFNVVTGPPCGPTTICKGGLTRALGALCDVNSTCTFNQFGTC